MKSILFIYLISTLILVFSAFADDTALDPSEPGEVLVSPITTQSINDYSELTTKIINREIKKGKYQVILTQEKTDLETLYSTLCVKKARKKCIKSIKQEIAVNVAWAILNSDLQTFMPRFEKLQKKVSIKDSVKSKKVLNYFKSDYKKNVGDVLLYVLGQGNIQQMSPSGAGSAAEYISWNLSPTALDSILNIALVKSELVSIKPEIPDTFVIKGLHVTIKNSGIVSKAIFSNMLGSEHVVLISDDLYKTGGVEYESYLAHELRHYTDWNDLREISDQTPTEQDLLRKQATDNNLGELEFDEISKWQSFSKLKDDASQSMLKQLNGTVKIDKATLEKRFVGFQKAAYIKEFTYLYGYLNSKIESRGYKEQIRYLRKNSSITLDDFYGNIFNGHVWLTPDQVHEYSDPVFAGNNNFALGHLTIIPNLVVDFFKTLFEAKNLDL